MQMHMLGYPRIGSNKELKKTCKKYWGDNIMLPKLPSNDVTFYDHVLDRAQGCQKNNLDIMAMKMTSQRRLGMSNNFVFVVLATMLHLKYYLSRFAPFKIP